MFDDLKNNALHARNARTKIITWLIFGAIILVFILWGLSPRNAGMMGTGGGVAHVNSATISLKDLNDAVTQMEQNMQGSPYASFFQGETGRQRMQEMALNQLVQQELVYQACASHNLMSSDSAVAEIIRGAPIFNDQGVFKRERYMTYIGNLHTTPAEFEEKLKRSATAQEAQRVFAEALRASPQEVKKQMELRDLKADVEYAEVSTSHLVTSADVSVDEAKTFLSGADGEKKAKDYFATHSSEFNTEEKIHARHILVKFDSKNSDSVKAAQKKAQDLLAQLKKGADFSKLAKENSDDPGSKEKGGDLEPFSKGRMDSEFEKSAFSLPLKTLSDLVKTQYGFHIIEVLEKLPKSVTSFDTAKTDIAKRLVADKKSEETMAQIRELLKKGDVAGVDKFVAARKIKWDSTGPFAITAQAVPKVGNNDEFAKWAFKLNSKTPVANELVRQGDKAYILKYKEVSKEALATPKASKKGSGKNADPSSEGAAKPATAEETASNITYQTSQDAFQAWIEAYRKTSRVDSTKNFASSQSGTPDDL